MTVQKHSLIAAVVILSVALCATQALAAKKPTPAKKGKAVATLTLKGVVLVEKSAKGKVTSVAIMTPVGDRLGLVLDASARKLAALVDQDVEVTAIEKRAKKGSTFRVKSFKAVQKPEPEPEPDDYGDEDSDEEAEPWDPDQEDE